jgi:hypothetical protein
MIPRRWGKRRIFVQDHHHTCAARASPDRWVRGHLRGGHLHDRLSPLNSGGDDWRERRAGLLCHGDGRLLFSPHWQRSIYPEN